MKHPTPFISIPIALIIGLLQTYLAAVCWSYIEMYSPLVHWLYGMGLRTAGIHAVAHPVDLLTSVLISIPAALVLARLRPERTWLYLLLAVIPSFVWLNWNLVVNPSLVQFPGEMAWGWLQELATLPAAAWLIKAVGRPGAKGESGRLAGMPRAKLG